MGILKDISSQLLQLHPAIAILVEKRVKSSKVAGIRKKLLITILTITCTMLMVAFGFNGMIRRSILSLSNPLVSSYNVGFITYFAISNNGLQLSILTTNWR